MTDKPVAKSLHTVTVIVQVARTFLDAGYDAVWSLDRAVLILGLASPRPDPYGLKAAAYKQLVGAKK
jgi:hypothetical protein